MDKQPRKDTYGSPRWSAEVLDCSMPMTFDTYNLCSYQCLYCFSYFQRMHYDDYVQNNILWVNAEKVKEIFRHPEKSQFSLYVKARIPMQWGGLSEPFDLQEQKIGVTLDLLKFFREIDYPVSFSSKSIWHLKDERYREVLKDAKNFHVKVSIITMDEKRARLMEKAVPTPLERLWAIGEYAKLGVSAVTLRLRPFIIGLSNPTHLELIRKAKEAGASGISTEFFCLEARANAELRMRYREMSNIVGYDIWDFYQQFSPTSGYRRLNYEIKRPYMVEMQQECARIGMNFHVSDANHKERCAWGSCCGVPEDSPYFKNFAKCQFTQAIVMARKNGEVKFSDITQYQNDYLKAVPFNGAQGFNTGSAETRAKNKYKSLYDFMRSVWNEPKRRLSPMNYFDKLLLPDRLDENGDVVYKFNQKKYEGK